MSHQLAVGAKTTIGFVFMERTVDFYKATIDTSFFVAEGFGKTAKEALVDALQAHDEHIEKMMTLKP